VAPVVGSRARLSLYTGRGDEVQDILVCEMLSRDIDTQIVHVHGGFDMQPLLCLISYEGQLSVIRPVASKPAAMYTVGYRAPSACTASRE
jgi:hypothetical protein